ncbi:3,4-dihydroxy-2-butanone 4-phosphate synthase [Natrialba magadii ATCC 43099]|uniref:3,4-dihydroxy-2-butanone 4-phosphate synthase n=1 Tax=Natrialba magadii (strain ATCC 43099 / DSM 3394 / CCM 3739 / CIP 104546 / IAM 13178 / JCM 8861 / NBRC 102185 / NCIMB 2190 / MS3) TaxID=547559 RepID=D3SQN8_NATMM|nr:3,4-dihydroxy-2-butanone-4-phosphate synthase [Natrialba magadii]ADD04526.1 3,4-dihydroxy-2-butanone 4-phosphate synthase [Natrialba magadii ATCC 43099]ELY25183.1 3,4-dihydroxy-2-butanone 4-phosphate synthase [Natrialba magadii ATCC 43099]
MTGQHAGTTPSETSGSGDSNASLDTAGREDASVDDALTALQAGEPILVHDAADREGETDLIYHADAVTPDAVARLRNDAGGLVCVALGHETAEAFDLPFYGEEVDHPATADHQLGYDERSSFSLTVNHRDTYTGITDNDRSTTIQALGEAAADPNAAAFAEEFRVPGHVHLLKGAPDLLAQRKGHTELGLALAEAAALSPAVVVCEMLDDETGEALSPADARAYAADNEFLYLEGRTVIDRLA